MLQLIGKKKYLFYILLLLSLSTINNLNLIETKELLSKIELIEVKGINKKINQQVKKKLSFLINSNIYLLDKEQINSILEDYNFLENYKVSKIYPSKIQINLKKTKLIATTTQNQRKYVVGLNGKLIEKELIEIDKELPNIFGEFYGEKFISLILKINGRDLNYRDIKNFYFFPSGRWDIQMKNNLIIKLPRDNVESTFNKVNKMIKNEITRNKNILDLRMTDQIILFDE